MPFIDVVDFVKQKLNPETLRTPEGNFTTTSVISTANYLADAEKGRDVVRWLPALFVKLSLDGVAINADLSYVLFLIISI